MNVHHLAAVCLLLVTACRRGAPPEVAAEPEPVETPPAAEEVEEPEVVEIVHERVDNPFEGARYFTDPFYERQALETLPYAPRELLRAIPMVARTPTAVWLARIAAIEGHEGRPSLRERLDEALRQAEQGPEPLTMVFVIYDLPDRDCAASASAGELRLAEDGMRRYREEFIDPIAALLGEPQYRALRHVIILEPDSLPNLVTNLETHEKCRDAASAYREGVAYAIARFAELPNAYVYLDIAHSGWLGWERPPEAAALYREVVESAGGMHKITGFATNISNYTPIAEPVDPYDAPEMHGRVISDFYSWNPIIDEHRYVDALREHFPDHGFVIDTGRNGWGGRAGSVPLDGRSHRGNWCNVEGAGLGESPRANPRPGVHAYFWVKPPGESDGASTEALADERHPYSAACNPETEPPTDAMANGPVAGDWFAEAFFELVRNANPPF